MSIYMMKEVTRISDRFIGRESEDSIDRQGRLASVMVAVFIFHAIMGVAFYKIDEYGRSHPTRVIAPTDLSFELMIQPKPVHVPKVEKLPVAPQLIEGQTENVGGSSSRNSNKGEKVTVAPVVKVPDTNNLPAPVPIAAQQIDRTIPEAPPVALNKPTDVTVKPAQQVVAPNLGAQNGAFSTAPASGAPIDGTTPDATEPDGVGGPGGNGGGGTGDGIGGGDGTTDAPVGGKLVVIKPPLPARAVGNIAPYRNSLLLALARNWHPQGRLHAVTLLLTIGKDGALLNSQILQSSGKDKFDRAALEAASTTEFPPLPEWYQGEQLNFKLELSSQQIR